jgi:hypothetical protein
MVQAHLGLPIVELYINLFSESIPDIDEGNDEDDNDNDDDDEMGYSRIEQDDPYWEEVNESDLFVDNDDVLGPSTGGGGLETSVGRVGRKVMVVWRVKRAMKVMRVKRKVMKTEVG